MKTPRARLHVRLVSTLFIRLTAAALLLGAAEVRASERSAALNWVRLSGAEACIGAAELAERVEQRLERSVFVVDSAARLSVDGAVQPSVTGFTVQLALSDRAGRVLGRRAIQSSAADCRQLDEAIVLVIALTLSPDRGLFPKGGIVLDGTTERLLQELFRDEPAELHVDELQARPASEPTALGPVPPIVTRAARDHAPQPVAGAARTQVNASIAGVVALGQLPGLAPGIEFALTVVPVDFWALQLTAAYLPKQTRRAVALSSGATSFDSSQAAVALCPWRTDQALLRMQLCAGLGLSLLRVVARGYAEDSGRRLDPIPSGQAQFDLQLKLWGRALLQLGAGLAVPFIQYSYAYQDLDGQPKPLFRVAQASARLGIGLGVEF